MTTTDPYATTRDTTEGKVFTVTGQDWDAVVAGLGDEPEERIVVNMGPQHPSTHGGRRIRVEVTCPETDRHIPSIVSVYPANDWHERETWDFFGIVFDGHPALTRIQMPDDWPGHPQRKDYPLGGIDVEYKGAVIPPPDTRRSYN